MKSTKESLGSGPPKFLERGFMLLKKQYTTQTC